MVVAAERLFLGPVVDTSMGLISRLDQLLEKIGESQVHQPSSSTSAGRDRLDQTTNKLPVLVIGQTADGKSTLPKALIAPELEDEDHPQTLVVGPMKGTTQCIARYPGIRIGEYQLELIDSPGFGCQRIMAWATEIMNQFDTNAEEQISAILVTCPAGTVTFGMGQRVICS